MADSAEQAGDVFEIVIAEDGRVIFRTATAEMLEVARALAPGVARRAGAGGPKAAAAEVREGEAEG